MVGSSWKSRSLGDVALVVIICLWFLELTLLAGLLWPEQSLWDHTAGNSATSPLPWETESPEALRQKRQKRQKKKKAFTHLSLSVRCYCHSYVKLTDVFSEHVGHRSHLCRSWHMSVIRYLLSLKCFITFSLTLLWCDYINISYGEHKLQEDLYKPQLATNYNFNCKLLNVDGLNGSAAKTACCQTWICLSPRSVW